MSAEDLDLVIHLGDYIYERGWRAGRDGQGMGIDVGEAVDLPTYRLHYAQYKSEQPLQDAHAAFPWLVTMDDHEVDNNWGGRSPGMGNDVYLVRPVFRRRLAAAFQAMYEHQPLRIAAVPDGPHMQLHRRYRFGDLADITMLDTRQYRAKGTILGAPQRDWLIDGFTGSPARWQVLGNQVAMGQVDNDPGPGVAVSSDAWDGYVGDRNAVLGAAADRDVPNLVVITGDRHQHIAADLRRDYTDPESPVVAAEFTGTSISTGGDGADLNDTGRALLAGNPDTKFFNAQRGYVRVELDHQVWRNDFRVVDYVRRPGAPIATRATFVVENGIPGVTGAHNARNLGNGTPTELGEGP